MTELDWKKINTPLTDKVIKSLKAGDLILLTGTVYTARDRAHDRLCSMAADNRELPFDPEGQIIYYMGPSPAPRGKIIGAAGPTTSYRMDPFSKTILELGVKGMIGKGKRNIETKKLLKKYKALYFSSFGGAGAYLSKRITEATLIAFEDLGPEAVYKIKVKDFPLVVINDISGGDLYEDKLR